VVDLAISSPYLRVLEQQRAALVAALAEVVTAEDVATAQRRSARLSVRLDASPLTDETADVVDASDATTAAASGPVSGGLPSANGEQVADATAATLHRESGRERIRPAQRPDARRGGAGWATALRLDGMPTQDIAAVEYRGMLDAQAAEAVMAETFLDAPVRTLVRVNRIVTGGLVAPDRLGALRRTSRAMHDGAQGRVIFQAPHPERLPDLLAELDGWVRTEGRAAPPLALAGVVHGRLLHWRPFEAGNGRVARLASRLALRASGGDPWGLAVPEDRYDADQLRYATEVAATIRRRTDLRPWNEWTGEAVVASLERAARARVVSPPTPDVRAVRVCRALDPGAAVTVLELAAAADLDRHTALVQANLLCWSRLLSRDPGTHGLRYVRAEMDVSDRAGRSTPK
jgi:hypothetical protein